jgi:hypothetical protein
MADPIEANYAPDGDDWTVTVKGRGKTLNGRAPGLIAARDRADQLVEQLTSEESGRKTVVHMLNGDAVEFTTAYLTARLARTEEPPVETPEPETTENETKDEVPAPAPAAEGQSPAPAKPTPAPRTAPEAPEPAPAPEEEPASSGG